MIDIIVKIVDNMLVLANAMSFYILIGLLMAGVLKQLVKDDFISSHLGENKTSSVIKATLFGIPMPVCSCSVIPLAKSLQKEGASKGAVQSFLISTPITGVDSILATYSFFGWFFTLYRVATSVVIAITTGLIQNYYEKETTIVQKQETQSCCSSGCCGSKKKEESKFSIKESFRYAYVTLFEDIYKSLFIGLVIGSVFTTFLPKELIGSLVEYKFLTYIAVLVIAMPLYVCATASLPIAAAFMLSGLSSGAAFVFLSAGPATNSVTMGVVASMFGKRSLMIYLGTIASLSVLFGFVLDNFFGDIQIINFQETNEDVNILDTISTIIMFGLIAYYMFFKKYLKKRD